MLFWNRNFLSENKSPARLLQKYPTIYNQIYNTLKASRESQRVTIREICEAINHTTRPAVVGEILNNVSWASNIGDSYIFSEDTPAIAPDTSNTESLHSQNTTFEIDFHADFDLAYTMPERFSYFGQDKETGDSWSVLYIQGSTIVSMKPYRNFSDLLTQTQLGPHLQRMVRNRQKPTEMKTMSRLSDNTLRRDSAWIRPLRYANSIGITWQSMIRN